MGRGAWGATVLGGLKELDPREQLGAHAESAFQVSYRKKCSLDFSISNTAKAPDVKKKKWGDGDVMGQTHFKDLHECN